MLKIKDKIKKWYDDFMIDPYFNSFMYIMIFFIILTLVLGLLGVIK